MLIFRFKWRFYLKSLNVETVHRQTPDFTSIYCTISLISYYIVRLPVSWAVLALIIVCIRDSPPHT